MARLRLPGLLLLACACAVSGGAARGAPFASTASPGDGKHGLLLEASVVLSSAAGATVDLASWSQHAWPQLDEAALFRSVQAEMPARSAAIAFAEADGVPRVDDVLARYAPPSMLPNGVRHASEAAAAAGLPPPLARAVRRSVLTAARTAAVWLKEEELEAEIGYKRIARALRRAGYEPSRPEMLGHNSWCTHAHNSHFAGRDWRAHRLASACSRHHRGLEWHEWLATWAASHSSLDDALHSPPPAAICSRRAAGAGLSLAKFMEDFCSAVYSDATDGSANLESPLSERQRREWALALHFIGEHLSNATSDPARLQTLRDHRKALTTKMFGYPPYHIMSPMSAFEDSLWHMAHDAEWLESLVETGRLPRPFLGLTYPLHLSIKQSLRSGAQPGGLFLLSHEIFPVIGASKGRRLYLETPRHVWGGMAAFRGDPFRSPYFMLNPRVNWVAAEQKYKEMEQLHGHGIVVIDDLLKPEALADLLSICQRSAAYFETKPAFYTGAYAEEGFGGSAIVALADALRAAMPHVIGGLPLRLAWSYKYGQESARQVKEATQAQGIGIHSDFGEVNVNIWLVPDDANLDPDGGGLEIFTSPPPRTDDKRRNAFGGMDQEDMQRYLRENGGTTIPIRYRANRAAIFHSDLFHRGVPTTFKPGYDNRRINLTLLFGFEARKNQAYEHPEVQPEGLLEQDLRNELPGVNVEEATAVNSV